MYRVRFMLSDPKDWHYAPSNRHFTLGESEEP